MAEIPQAFPETGGSAVASYDQRDLANGTGITAFSLALASFSGSNTSILTQSTIYSHDAELSGSTSSTGLISDVDYDLTSFNLPQDIKGTAYVNIPNTLATGGGTGTSFLRVFLRKWDGTTETDIASAMSATLDCSSADRGRVHLISLPITTPVHFTTGETLRLTVQQYIPASTGTVRWAYGIDPKDRSTGVYMTNINGVTMPTTNSVAHIPFRIDI